jgi:hypothetical protein
MKLGQQVLPRKTKEGAPRDSFHPSAGSRRWFISDSLASACLLVLSLLPQFWCSWEPWHGNFFFSPRSTLLRADLDAYIANTTNLTNVAMDSVPVQSCLTAVFGGHMQNTGVVAACKNNHPDPSKSFKPLEHFAACLNPSYRQQADGWVQVPTCPDS